MSAKDVSTVDAIYVRKNPAKVAGMYSLASISHYMESIWVPHSFETVDDILGDYNSEKVFVSVGPLEKDEAALQAVTARVGEVVDIAQLTSDKIKSINGYPIYVKFKYPIMTWPGILPVMEEGDTVICLSSHRYINSSLRDINADTLFVSDNNIVVNTGHRLYAINANVTRITYEPEKIAEIVKTHKEKTELRIFTRLVSSYKVYLQHMLDRISNATLSYVSRCVERKHEGTFPPYVRNVSFRIRTINSDGFREAAKYVFGTCDILSIVRKAFKHSDFPAFVDYPDSKADFDEFLKYPSHWYINELVHGYSSFVSKHRAIAEELGVEEGKSRTGKYIVGVNTLFKNHPEILEVYHTLMDNKQLSVYKYLYNKANEACKKRGNKISHELHVVFRNILDATFALAPADKSKVRVEE